MAVPIRSIEKCRTVHPVNAGVWFAIAVAVVAFVLASATRTHAAAGPDSSAANTSATASNSPIASTHWAFVPPAQVAPPRVKHPRWVQSPIDAFVLARLEAAGLEPAAPAAKPTLLRRVTFDLTGLPPTEAELDAFLADHRPGAFARVVDRLLASPRYGERWGRRWLDLARYADSNGQDENKSMANAWRYRDYVIKSFNQDKPFDQFIREQLAGDLLPPSPDPSVNADRFTATGFLVLGPKMLAEQDKPKLVMDVVDEQIDVVSRAFLGLTISCSRCHDHKFDPVPTRDYYALAGIFKSTKTMADLAFVSKWNERPVATPEERARYTRFVEQTNTVAHQLAQSLASANDELNSRWRRAAPDYFLAAERGIKSEVGSPDLQGLHGPTLDRWIQWLRSDATNPSPVLSAYRPAASHLQEFSSLVDTLARTPTNLSPTTVRFGPGHTGAGLLCTGANYLEVPHSSDLEPSNLTVEAWVRLDQAPIDSDTRRWLVNKNANEWEDGHYALVLDGRRAGAYLNIGGGREHVAAVWSAPDSIPLHAWRHLAFTYDGSDLRLYLDGALASETHLGRPRQPGHASLQLARRQDGYNFFAGSLDDVRLYRRALPPAEILSHRDGKTARSTDGLIQEWTFEPSTAEERVRWEHEGLREKLFGQDGLLLPPTERRPLYSTSQLHQIEMLETELAQLRTNAPAPPPVALAVEETTPVNLPVHLRGSHLSPSGPPVPRGFVQVASRHPAPIIPTDQSGRQQLAEWLTQPDHPLTARVTINRIWQGHFGEGLVRTPDNFGIRGEPPTHPELLDWLANEFIRSGWSVKSMHRLLLLSSAYQMSTAFHREGAAQDPENRLLWRMNRQRLEAEPVRDALLAIGGQLDLTMGGSLVTWNNAGYTPDDTVSAVSHRRAVYLPVVRDRVYDVFTIFDFANPSVGVGQRTPTVVSHQALFFLNSPLVKEESRQLAHQLMALPKLDDAARVNVAYRRVLGRPASASERKQALAFLRETNPSPSPTAEAWASLCQALLASNEFLYLD